MALRTRCRKTKEKQVGKVAAAGLFVFFNLTATSYVNEILMPLNCGPAPCYTANGFVPLSAAVSVNVNLIPVPF